MRRVIAGSWDLRPSKRAPVADSDEAADNRTAYGPVNGLGATSF